jgi:hypothetical protein
MSNEGSMEGVDIPSGIIDYIAEQSECSKDLAQLSLMAVSGWDGENLDVPVEGLASFADQAERVTSAVKYIMTKYHIDQDLAFKILILTKDIIDNGGLPEDQNISPDFVAYCLLNTRNPDGTLNKENAGLLAFSVHIFTTENPRFNQNEIVNTVVEIMNSRNIDLETAMPIVFQRLDGLPLPPQGGKSKKSKSKKHNRKSRVKKHNKRSKSKKIRKP